MNVDTAAAQRLAGAFVILLQRDLSRADYFAARMKNRTAGEGVCASHDYCDANMVMDEAFTGLFDRSAASTDEDCALWNAAWEVAKTEHLTDTTTSIAKMTADYEQWCTAQGLPLVSADEQDFLKVTREQAAWLVWFIERWEIVQDFEDGR